MLADKDNDTIEKLNAGNIYGPVNIDLMHDPCNEIYDEYYICISIVKWLEKLPRYIMYNAIVQRNVGGPTTAAKELETVSFHFSGNHDSCSLVANSWCTCAPAIYNQC